MLILVVVVAVLGIAAVVGHWWFVIHAGYGAFRCSQIRHYITHSGASKVKIRKGTARYGSEKLVWWKDWSLGLTPSAVWSRGQIEVISREPCPRGCQDNYVVHLSYRGQEQELEMSRGSYTGFTSWLEATALPTNWVV